MTTTDMRSMAYKKQSFLGDASSQDSGHSSHSLRAMPTNIARQPLLRIINTTHD